MIVLIFILIMGQWMLARGQNWRSALISWGMFLSSGILTLISLFYWIWGYNYARAPLTQTYFDNQIVKVDSSKFIERWNLQTQRVNYIRENLVIPDSTDKSLTPTRSEEHTSELQSRGHLVCRLL